MKRLLVALGHPPPSQLSIEGSRFHHLVRVLRAQEGERIELFDGQGGSFLATVSAILEDRATLSIDEALPERRSSRAYYVLQGIPKGDKLETILQKGTELGATAFAPVEMARSVVRLDDAKGLQKTARWRKIVEEAARQCGRADVPEVWPPDTLPSALARLPPHTQVLALDEGETRLRLSEAFSDLEPDTPVALVVGPEGGLDPAERAQLNAHRARAVTLGPRILRTETAAMAALAVLLHHDGALG